jgi:formamidopyrimidine-DNA glycosylase
MPEIAEVEFARRLIEQNCVGKRIVKVHYLETGSGPRDGLFDDIVFKPDSIKSGEYFQEHMLHRTLSCVRRKGKYIVWVMDDGKGLQPVFHFGMFKKLQQVIVNDDLFLLMIICMQYG